MTLFTRLGNSILDRLAPEASAAGYNVCTYGCFDYVKQTKCVGATLYIRCCHPNFPVEMCPNWTSCGPQCA
ncbi:hypothetical protein [Streptomyces sp. NPDC047976]|uniref:hypothetical protein n=1 Tax=unclassified Streptomyces TaxID=2593676 RepID=UPI0034288AA7